MLILQIVGIICFIVGLVINDTTFTTEKWFIKEHKSIIYGNQTKLTGSDPNGNDYSISQQKNRAELKLNGDKGYDTQVVEGMVQAKDKKTGQQVSANKVGSGGMAQAGNNRGTLRTSQNDGNDTVAYLDGNGEKLNVKQVNNSKTFEAQGSKNKWQVRPSSLTEAGSNGVLAQDNKTLNYILTKNANGEAVAELSDDTNSILSKSTKYKCIAQTVGVSTCYDVWGKKVGEVRATSNNEVTISDAKGVPVATAKAIKDTDGIPMVVVNNGLLIAKCDKQQDYNCSGVPTDAVTIQKNIQFKYSNQKTADDGGVVYSWPSCIELAADIVLKPGVDAKNLVFKWTVNVLPLGRLQCKDQGSNLCLKTGDCMYCNLCDPRNAKTELLTNVFTNVCEARGGNTFTVKATVCPPPEVHHFLLCDEFTKKLGDIYWNKKGDIDVIFEILNRKTDAQFQSEWKDIIKRTTLIAEYKTNSNIEKLENILEVPSEEDVKNWYAFAKADKLACRESIVSYTISGSKIKTDFLLEAATVGGIFKKSDCKN